MKVMSVYCTNCGAAVQLDAQKTVGYCIECGNLLVMPGRQVAPPACPPDNKKMITLVYKKYPKKEIRNLMIEFYSKMYPKWQVKRMIRVFEKQIEERGGENVPEHFGELVADRLLTGKHPFNLTVIYDEIDKAIAEGATRADIIEYYDLFFLQKMMVEWSEQVIRYAVYKSAIEEDRLSEDEAFIKLRKMFPMYGDPTDTTNVQGEDRMLPPILRGRVDECRNTIGAEGMNALVQKYSTYNACVRALIRKGLI